MDTILTIPVDIILSILGLAFSVGGLVPVFFLNDQKRTLVVSLAVVLSALAAISATTSVRIQNRQRQVEHMSGEIVERIGGGSLTFDQLYEQLYYPNYSVLSDAVNALIEKGIMGHNVLEVHDDTGRLFHVKGFYVKHDRK